MARGQRDGQAGGPATIENGNDGPAPMHILFLTDNFPPEVNAPASRTYEHAREWVRAGHKVTVITCAPNFPQGKLFEGYENRWRQHETLDGIEVVRVWSYITANEGFVKRTLDYLSFMVSAALRGRGMRDVDVVVGTSPQFFTAVAAWHVARKLKRPFVFELRDLWPESIRAVGAVKDGAVLRAFERLELFLYRKAAAIICVTNAFRRNLIERGIQGDKIEVVTNGVDLTRFRPRTKPLELVERYDLQDKFVAGYVGTHGMAHALGTLLDVATLAREADQDDIVILLLGSGARRQALLQRKQRERLDNVIMLETVPKDMVADHWALLDASIIHLSDSPLFETVIPSKLFECMGMGLPVLHGVRGESAAIVEQAYCGIVVPPGDAPALLAAIRRLRDEPALRKELTDNGLAAAPRYDRKTLAARMLAIFGRVTACTTERG